MTARMSWQVEGETTPLLDALQRDFDALLASAQSEARVRVGGKRFYRIADEAGREALYVKVFRAPRGLARWATLGRRSKARRESDRARAVAARGFRTAAPVARAEERRAGLLGRSVSIVRELPLRDLREVLQDPETRVTERRRLLLSFAELQRRLHDAGVDQDDTSPNNFLVDSGGGWVLIDFERCRLGRRLGRRRWKLLAKLHRHELGVPRGDRLRFLRAYLGADGDRPGRRAAWTRIQPEFLAVRRRDARHAARGAFRPGRHVGRDGATWYVKGREEAPAIRLNLGTERSRAVWTLSHVFERLALPALRPVRLDGPGVDLLAPDLDDHAMEFHAAVARARRRFEPYGRFVREPQWALTKTGAILLTPDAFKLRI